MNRVIIAVYGVIAYAVGLGGLVAFVVFLGGWDFLPLHINSKVPGAVGTALAANLGLLLLFGLQHSVMARPWFKSRWTRLVPAAAERSTYVLLSGMLMAAICVGWQPLPGVLWKAESAAAVALLTGGYLLGWAIAVVATFLISHAELFGLRQVYLNLKRCPEPSAGLVETGLYRFVRHPLQSGVLMGVWFTPLMTSTHLLLAVGMTLYILVGLYFEERDLVRTFGDDYRDYQARVGRLLPLPRSARHSRSRAATAR